MDIQKQNKYICKVKEKITLISFLLKEREGMSRNKAKSLIENGYVKVNDIFENKANKLLNISDLVSVISYKEKIKSLYSEWFSIIYEDKHIIVINKKEGVLSMCPHNKGINLKMLLDDYFLKSNQGCSAHVVHRLDKYTSGLLVFAKRIDVQQFLIKNWDKIVIKRNYYAIVCGCVKKSKTVKSWLKENSSYYVYSSLTNNGGKLAVTHYKPIKYSPNFSLLDVSLETGRKNQIRVHLKEEGFPICGDLKYGNGINPIGRLALHAYLLEFYHPISKERISTKTGNPFNMDKLFKGIKE